jgi:3-hydroxyisobutyrate dehydrogenase-like beta-hydroxyacid dehydrogenase
MVGNLTKAGATIIAYDPDDRALQSAVESTGAVAAASTEEVTKQARVVFTAVPDDRVLNAVVKDLLPGLAARGDKAVHVSCSTVAPSTSVTLAASHADREVGFVAAPVFARPDGMRRGEATIPVSGADWAKALAIPPLERTSLGVHDFGENPGAANVVKLGGNFLIAAAIESMAEAAALAESNGVDRERFISLMSSTIFDCLIYKGYGHRVATRDHHPHIDAHFALDLGTKDVALVHSAAAESRCPMPIASLIRDRFVASQNLGRGKLDWSALALRASEDAGSQEVSAAVEQLLSNLKK